MKKSFSLRTRFFALMALLVFLQSLAFLFVLQMSHVFTMLDAEAFRLFDSTTSARTQTYNASMGGLIKHMADEVTALNRRLQQIAERDGIESAQLYLDDDSYNDAAVEGAGTLLSLLQNNNISGAFLILNGSNASKEQSEAHSAVYIRDSAQDSAGENTSRYILEIGPIAVSEFYQITSAVNWDLDIYMPAGEGDYRFYENPMWAAQEYPHSEIERYGYWSSPIDILGIQQEMVCYTMPLLDAKGEPFGVLGIDISLPTFSMEYLPNGELPYQNSFYVIAPLRDDVFDLTWYLTSGPVPQVYLRQGDSLSFAAVPDTNLYKTEVQGLGETYCSVHSLVMYSANSLFYDESWTLVGFVPKQVLQETSTSVRTTLIVSITTTLLASLVAIFFIVAFNMRRISGLSKYVRSLTPYMDMHFTRTGIREIDELIAAVEMLNKSVVNASKTTSKILELTLLPIGGFEVSNETNYVIITEYLYSLLDIEAGTRISRKEWENIYSKLVARPAPNYDDIYGYEDAQGLSKWLRILEVETETGKIGVILDVSKDIEEHRRLAHELDYDALTHLHNRTAFKRDVHLMIQNEPDKVGMMIFSDLDNLKYINDTFGHDTGDRLIIRAGEMFSQFEKYGGIASRISGDEFAIYLHGLSSKEQAREILYKQFAENEKCFLLTPGGSTQKIRSSSGVAFYPDDADNVTDLLKLSDFAMYEAKHKRKGTVFEFSAESYEAESFLLDNREAINRLLDEKLIRFAFQPIVDLRTGEVYAYEALMRSELENFKSPLEILAVAEAQSLLGRVEHLVMMCAFETVRSKTEELNGIKIFINSISNQALGDEDLQYLQKHYSDLFKEIVIEITEAENDYLGVIHQKSTYMRKHGIQIAVDDYGSGYSNDSRMLALHPDIVKIDISLVSNIDTDADKQKLVGNLVSFCKPKGIRLISEGVERSEELAALVRLDIDYVQGYYIAHPGFSLQGVSPEHKEEILRLQAKRATWIAREGEALESDNL